jgi:hypothetical protein
VTFQNVILKYKLIKIHFLKPKFSILLILLLLFLHQLPDHMPQMHRSLYAYCATLKPPPAVLDVPNSAASCLHVHTTRDILAAKGGTVGENVGR